MDYKQIYKTAAEKKEIIAIDKKKLLWIEEVLEKKKEERKKLFGEICEMEYSIKKLEKITFDNILKKLKEDYDWIYRRKCERMKMTKAKYEEMLVEIEILRQKRNRIGSHIRQEKQKLDKLQQELKIYPEAQDMLKEQEKQKEIILNRAEELKREIAFVEERIVLSEEAKREFMGEEKKAGPYMAAQTALNIISIGITGTVTFDLNNVLNSNSDQLQNNIIQKEREVFNMTDQLSMLKSQLKEIESKLEEYN